MTERNVVIDFDRKSLGRLQCDAPGCGYVTPEARPLDPSSIGEPCPRCGASLLTREDFERTVAMLAGIDAINDTLGPLFGKPATGGPVKGNVRVSIHGDVTTIRTLKG